MKRKTVSACVNDTEHTSERHDVQREIISPRRRIIFLELTVICKRKSVWSHEKHTKLDRRTEISGISRFASEDRTFLPNTSSLVANTFLHSAAWCGIRSNTFGDGVHVASRSWRSSSTDFRNAFASNNKQLSYFYVSTSIFLAYCRILSALHEGHGGCTVGSFLITLSRAAENCDRNYGSSSAMCHQSSRARIKLSLVYGLLVDLE